MEEMRTIRRRMREENVENLNQIPNWNNLEVQLKKKKNVWGDDLGRGRSIKTDSVECVW